MALGKKTGGRVKGTPNKKTQVVQKKLEALGCDPIEGMAILAMDEGNEPQVRLNAYKELAQYVAPKLSAIQMDIDADIKATPKLVINLNGIKSTPETEPSISESIN